MELKKPSLFETAVRDIGELCAYSRQSTMGKIAYNLAMGGTVEIFVDDWQDSGKNPANYIIDLYQLDENKSQDMVRKLAEVAGVEV